MKVVARGFLVILSLALFWGPAFAGGDMESAGYYSDRCGPEHSG